LLGLAPQTLVALTSLWGRRDIFTRFSTRPSKPPGLLYQHFSPPFTGSPAGKLFPSRTPPTLGACTPFGKPFFLPAPLRGRPSHPSCRWGLPLILYPLVGGNLTNFTPFRHHHINIFGGARTWGLPNFNSYHHAWVGKYGATFWRPQPKGYTSWSLDDIGVLPPSHLLGSSGQLFHSAQNESPVSSPG